MKKRLVFLLPLLAFLLCAGLFASALLKKDDPRGAAHMIGQPAPAFTEIDSPALINIFASWCLPCEAEHAAIMRLYEQGIPVYGINYKDNPERAAAFLKRLGNPYRDILPDPNGAIALDFAMRGVPTSFIVDSDGIITARYDQPLTLEMVEHIILPQIKGDAP